MADEARRDDAELDKLLSRYLDGLLDAGELAQLESRLLTDPAFADYFSRWCLLHRQITELQTEDALHELMEQFVQGGPTLPKGILARSAARSTNNLAAARSKTGLGRIFQTAAAIAVAATIAFGTWLVVHRDAPITNSETQLIAANQGTANTDNPNAANDNSDDHAIIATLTQVSDAVWTPGAPVLRHGQQLGKNSRVALQAGMAKVTFDCGAEVVLQAPCDFVVESQMMGYLKSGRLTADVPRRAFRFAIRSPEVDFIDLGTSFGVNVGSNGRTALHVFQGEVLCGKTKNDAGIRNEVIHVTADKAIEFNARGSDPADIAMDKGQFSRMIALRRATGGDHEHVLPDHLALWLAADVAVTTDDKNRVVSWQDIIYGDNRSAEDAVQDEADARPTLVQNAVHGRPAIRFDGNSDYLLTTPLETTDDQTVLLVCQYAPSAFEKGRRWGGQIINYDGPPSRYLSDTLEPGVLQIGEPLLETEFKPTLLTGQVFGGFVGSATVEAGRVDAEPIGADVPVVVAYRYDYTHGKATLAVNGRVYGESRAFAPQGITSRKIIGRHAWMQLYFGGDLAEMQIYNKALAPEELASATAYLADKYSIAINGTSPSEPEAGK